MPIQSPAGYRWLGTAATLHYDARMSTAPMSRPPTAAEALQRARALPKVLLHEHLDGGLRVETLLHWLGRRGLPTPADTPEALAAWFDARAHAGSLVEYLRGFGLTVAAMADPEALRQVAREAGEDAAADGVLLAELRIAPLLFEAHGLDAAEAIECLLAGLAEAPIPCGLIVCAMRHLPTADTERAAELALRFAHRGVVGFDLAGAELGHPPSEHAKALAMCREAGLALTLHAGEADVAERVIEAARLGARRVGHGVHLVDALRDPARRHLIDEALDRDLHLEVCPTSNVHTGIAASVADHPITALWQAGLSVGLNTDNRLMSCLGVNDEVANLLRETPLGEADLLSMAREAARHSFLPVAVRQAAISRIEAEADHLGLALRGR
jgi:adenosine deaminase